jgi:glycosyltransferase involved in cell wall biosynthesis
VTLRRLLFASVHGYVDPSSGAAWATRDLLELLAGRGVECRAITAGVLSHDGETPLGPVLAAARVSLRPAAPIPGDPGPLDACEFELGGVGVTLVPTASSRIGRSPDRAESLAFLRRVDLALAEFRPQVLLTYGGHPAGLESMALARRRGVPVVFHLHNFAYDNRRDFADASAIVVPSECCRRHYAGRLGLESVAIPSPLVPDRVVAADREPVYLTFVNPQPSKGAGVFARIAAELHRRRPEIPLLVVEGRGKAVGLAGLGLDLSGLRNLHWLPNSPDPRSIYRQTRALLAPSLVRETFGRVASEAMANGIPVLASDRGALPETLGDSGFLFTLPERCGTGVGEVPTPREVAPWVATIERLWDDPAWAEAQGARAREAARRWDPDLVAGRYLAFFESVARPD